MRTFVLVHGAGHGGWCYRFVAQRLRARGHDVHTPTLTGLGDRSHLLSDRVDLNLHIEDVVQLLNVEDLRDVVLVGHSYGGTVVTGAADRTAERIAHLVYLDAPYPQNGKSLADVVGAPIRGTRKASRVVDGVEVVLFPEAAVLDALGVHDPQLRAWMQPKLRPHPWKCFEQPLVLKDEAATRAIPQSHVVCTSRLAAWDAAALQAAANGRFWDIDTGHDLMITEPDAVTDLLVRIAAA